MPGHVCSGRGVLLEWTAREGQGPSALGEELQGYYPHS